jgi:short-subunit dehydrogenase
MDIKDKVIVITGASEGIGAATARHLGALGGKIVLAARTTEKLEKVMDEIHGAVSIKTDMTKPSDIANLLDKTVEHFGRIDILINNAGRSITGPIETLDIEGYKSIFELNVIGPLRAMEYVIPIMRKQGGGMILNISSGVSKRYIPNLGGYSSTKYALNAISLTARAELESEYIIVSVMHPGLTATEFGNNSIRSSNSAQFSPANFANGHTPEHVAEAIAAQILSGQDEYHLYKEQFPVKE